MSEKGRLKIFFGYSAGVGKTYSMLTEAHELLEDGVDVVIGYIEPHDREETMQKTKGLEQVPLKSIDYRGIKLNEMDVDAIIERKPELVLVDELAHTNADGSKNSKRYLDVIELLNHGINVYTTVNVQHIKGLNDIVGSVTNVNVGELIPDTIFDNATEVKFVDLEPTELLQRLRSGKVYSNSKVVTALENFFSEENLANLRAIAMRRCADRINNINRIKDIIPKILVLISPSPSSAKSIMVAARMAQAYHCRFCAMYVQTNVTLTEESQQNLDNHFKSVKELDGELIIKHGIDVIDSVESYVKANGITHILVGKTWQSIGKKVGFEEEIITRFPDVEVLIVPDKQSIDRGVKRRLKRPQQLKLFALTIIINLILGIGLYFVEPIASIIIMSLSCSITALACYMFYRRSLGDKSSYDKANRLLDTISSINAIFKRTQYGYLEIAKVLSNSVGRKLMLMVDGSRYMSSEDAYLVFDDKKEKTVIEWSKENMSLAGKGTETFRNVKGMYIPFEAHSHTIVLGVDCSDRALDITTRLLLENVKEYLSIII